MSTPDPLAAFLPPTDDKKKKDDPLAAFLPPAEAAPEPKEEKGFFSRVAENWSGATQRMNEADQRKVEGVQQFGEFAVGQREYEDMPAIQETEEWKNLGLGDRAASVFSSGNAVDKAFMEANPQLERGAPDKFGNEMVYKDGKPYALYEQPGFLNTTDLREGAINVGVSVVPGLGAASVLNKATQVGRLGRATVAGIVEGTAAYQQEKRDLDEGINPWVVAGGALTPAVGEALGAAFKGVSNAKMKRFYEEGRKYAQDKGIVLTGDKAQKGYETFGMRNLGHLKHDEVTDDAIVLMTQYDTPMTVGQATRNEQRLGREQALREKGFKEVTQIDSAQRQAVERNIVEPKMRETQAGRSENVTGEELKQTLETAEERTRLAAKGEQQARDDAIDAAGTIDPDTLKPLEMKVANTIDEFRIDMRRNKATTKQSRNLMNPLLDDIERTIARGKDRLIKEEVPYKPAVKEGNVPKQVQREMKYMKVKPEDQAYVQRRLERFRDIQPDSEEARNILFELRDKGYRQSDINSAMKNIQGVRRPAPSEPKQPAQWEKGEQMHMDELLRVNEDINAAMRAAKAGSKDKAAITRLKGEFEDYMTNDLTEMMKDNPLALAALGAIDEANDSYKVFKQAYQKAYPKDRIGHLMSDIKNMDADNIVETIVGGKNIKLTSNELNKLINAGAMSGRFGDVKDAAKVRELVTEAVERRIWSDAKTGITEQSPDQAFKVLHGIIHGKNQNLGKALYTKAQRADRENILKALDALRRNPTSKESIEIFNSAYARMNLGAFRTVMSIDQALGYPWRKMMAKGARNPLKAQRGELSGMTYLQAAAAYEAGKLDKGERR